MNPYRILNISPQATSREIVQASARALREDKHSARDIAEARKQLMNPATRRLLDFIHTVDLEPLLNEVRKGLGELEGVEKEAITRFEGWDIFDNQV
ncbi:MAG: hypothetical protein WGN25_14280 [Candidatus Electrothrix sp. GW3-4]|uniref:hypothetical protein n=1 Tax=Candidatus Electrothrix sp. GW3-4 TaxID=3126740 RepID=UPI0030CE294F